MNMKRHRVAAVSDVPEGGRKLTTRRGMELGIFRVGDQFVAYRNVCPHAGAPICVGKICGTNELSKVSEYKYGRHNQILRCPWHGWEFDLATGEHLADPRVRLKSYPVEVEGDDIYVLLPEESNRR